MNRKNIRLGTLALGMIAGMLLTLAITRLLPGQITGAATQSVGDLTGTWQATLDGNGGQSEAILKLKQDGENVTGTITGPNGDDLEIQDGKVKDGQAVLKIVRDFNGNRVITSYIGNVTVFTFKGRSEQATVRNFDAKRMQP